MCSGMRRKGLNGRLLAAWLAVISCAVMLAAAFFTGSSSSSSSMMMSNTAGKLGLSPALHSMMRVQQANVPLPMVGGKQQHSHSKKFGRHRLHALSRSELVLGDKNQAPRRTTINRRTFVRATQQSPTPQDAEQKQEDFSHLYEQSWFDKLALGLFRSLVQREIGYKSESSNYEGLIDEAKNYQLNQRASAEEQQNMVVSVLRTMAGPFPPLYKAIMPKLPTPLASFLTSLFTPTVFGFLVGESGLSSTRDDRPLQGVKVTRCRFLAETGCKGLCINMCKKPTERFFREDMGFPMEMRPNFETCECTLSYGLEPLPIEQDMDVPAGCLVGCAGAAALGPESTRSVVCSAVGQGQPIRSPASIDLQANTATAAATAVASAAGASSSEMGAAGGGGGGGDGGESSKFPSFVPQEPAKEIQEEDCIRLLESLARLPVKLPSKNNQQVETVVAGGVDQMVNQKSDVPPIVMLHGFDSSALEYRRLIPALKRLKKEMSEQEQEQHLRAWAIDLIGWGFSEASGEVDKIGPNEKRENLYELWKTYVKEPMVLVGSSLGGAIAIDFALEHPDAVKGLVLIDAQAWIDGVQSPPEIFMDLGLNVLRSEPLRQIANVQSYYNKDKYATDDALKIGRLHTFMPNWKTYNKKWMQGGGYIISERIKDLQVPTMVLWGAQDKILGTEPAEKFKNALPSASLVWVDECGHVPHLEQAEFTAEKLLTFASELTSTANDAQKLQDQAFAQ